MDEQLQEWRETLEQEVDVLDTIIAGLGRMEALYRQSLADLRRFRADIDGIFGPEIGAEECGEESLATVYEELEAGQIRVGETFYGKGA